MYVVLLDKMADEAAGLPSSSTQQNPLSKKLSKILETNLDNDKEVLQALEVLSGFLDQNTLQARRNLRSDLELRSLTLNQSFLQSVGQLVDHVNGLKKDVTFMRECCDNMQRRLSGAKASTADLLRETAELKQRARLLEVSAKAVNSFLARFELTAEELNALKGAQNYQRDAVNEIFFRAMDRVKGIHEDCKALLRTSQQRAGIEIMEAMAMHLERGYEHLYHWTQNRCRAMNGEIPEVGKNFRRALEVLKERPILLQYCIDEYNLARRMTLVRLFIDALTRGERGSGRPIELHSHDAPRYCSDMLGWLHQAVATENDHVSVLLPDSSRERVMSMLAAVTEGASHPLRVRIEAVTVATTDSVTAYQLANLFRYYVGVFRALLGPTASLTQTVADLLDLQSKMFFSALNVQTSRLLEAPDAPLSDLVPTPSVNAMLSLLQRILSSRDMNSLAHENQEQDTRRILSATLDPLVQHCAESASAQLGRLERAQYMVNCLNLIHSTVALYEFTEGQLEVLEAQMQSNVDSISELLSRHLLELAGMAVLHDKLLLAHDQAASLDSEVLAECAEKMTALIAASDHHHRLCRLVVSARLRGDAYRGGVDRFVNAFQLVYKTVAADLGEEAVMKYFPYTPEQIRQLLL